MPCRFLFIGDVVYGLFLSVEVESSFGVRLQHLRRAHVVALFYVHSGYLIHFVVGKRKIEQIKVVLDVLTAL